MHRDSRQGLVSWLIFIVVAAALGALVWTGWSLMQRHVIALPGEGTVKSDSAVTVGLVGAPESLDVRTSTDGAATRALIGNVYETLLSRDAKNQLTAGVASSWKTSQDGRTLTLTIDGGRTFSNGHTLDSSDVVWSLQQAVQGNWPDADTKLAALESVTNPNPTTVKIALKEPDATLPRTLAGHLGIVYDSEAKINYAKEAVGSGPFTVAGFQDGVLTFQARKDGDAKTNVVKLKYFADDGALVKAAEYGGIDVAIPDDPANADALKDDPSFTVKDGTSTRKVVLLYNNDTESILSIPRVRQAVTMLIDKQALTQGRADVAQLLGGPAGPLEPGYEDLTSVNAYDKTKAQQMLTYFSSRYLGTFQFITTAEMQPLAQGIADQLTSAGLKVNVETLDADQIKQRVDARTFNLMLDTLDGVDGTAAFADANSTSHYTNGDAQQQYQTAIRATNAEDYEAGLKTFARTVSEDAGSDWLYAKRTAVAASTKTSGYPTSMTDDLLPLADVVKR
ncbi:ABC transporter substrate-binding protein [Bifidobacterium sp. CP2]|uniref:ABC transporter substrate-binding protein n=1 Tax=Bifidobacterium sp. CP2 TaxID=2809025 RepID=UPI001BDD185D|nr:ABC transporter substrate-binding protein [Bifidobacterium sp. CP2]MBT1181728.1 ABC transporter substrate-binding protein [Bifidobacterium sp. CP2]